MRLRRSHDAESAPSRSRSASRRRAGNRARVANLRQRRRDAHPHHELAIVDQRRHQIYNLDAAILLERRKPRQRANRRHSRARRFAVSRVVARDVDGALVAQLGHPGYGVRSYHVEVGFALECLREMRECAIVARLAEREHGLGFDEITRVALCDDIGQRRRRTRVAAEITERAHDRRAAPSDAPA